MSVLARSAIAAVLLAAAPAAADDDAAKAAELFTRGRQLVKSGDPASACPLFQESLRLVPALGTQLNLALCWAATGQLAAARALLVDVEHQAMAANQPERAQMAREAREAVEKKLAASTVVEPTGPDPETEKETKPSEPKHEQEHEQVHEQVHEATETGRPMSVWITGGAAAGVLAIGTVLGATTIREREAALHHCLPGDPAVCDERGIELLGHARTMSHVTTAVFVTGLGLGAAALVLELRSHDVAAPPIVVSPSPERVTLDWIGTW